MQNSRIIRKFERFLFKGIPEQPESTFERDPNMIASIRQTGMPPSLQNNSNGISYTVIGKIVYDFGKKERTFIPNK